MNCPPKLRRLATAAIAAWAIAASYGATACYYRVEPLVDCAETTCIPCGGSYLGQDYFSTFVVSTTMGTGYSGKDKNCLSYWLCNNQSGSYMTYCTQTPTSPGWRLTGFCRN